MDLQPFEIVDGIVWFRGRLSRNLMLWPIVSHTYFLEDGHDVIIFDPSCGKAIAREVEAYIRRRFRNQAKWKRAFIIAGHSHMDHAGNFYLSDVIGAPETHVYVHECGLQNGSVKNDPPSFIEAMAEESQRYYNLYRSFAFPYSLLMVPLWALDALSPLLARKVFGKIGGFPWPLPKNGSAAPEPLKSDDIQVIHLGDLELRGWHVGGKIVLPTPGHTPCSISLFWPEKKALFVSDAVWSGNPVFLSGSFKETIASLKDLKALTAAGKVALLLPGHGPIVEGREPILRFLELHIRFLEVMRDEVLSAYRTCGKQKDVDYLTRILVKESPVFKMLKLVSYPRLVVFVYNIVAVCLREEGLLK